jgi:hypothetical protein
MNAPIKPEDDCAFTWNYRIVNLKSENGGEDWYCLREVVYDTQGNPQGSMTPCVGGDSMEEMRSMMSLIAQATTSPAIQEEDFK